MLVFVTGCPKLNNPMHVETNNVVNDPATPIPTATPITPVLTQTSIVPTATPIVTAVLPTPTPVPTCGTYYSSVFATNWVLNYLNYNTNVDGFEYDFYNNGLISAKGYAYKDISNYSSGPLVVTFNLRTKDFSSYLDKDIVIAVVDNHSTLMGFKLRLQYSNGAYKVLYYINGIGYHQEQYTHLYETRYIPIKMVFNGSSSTVQIDNGVIVPYTGADGGYDFSSPNLTLSILFNLKTDGSLTNPISYSPRMIFNNLSVRNCE